MTESALETNNMPPNSFCASTHSNESRLSSLNDFTSGSILTLDTQVVERGNGIQSLPHSAFTIIKHGFCSFHRVGNTPSLEKPKDL